MRGRLPVSTKQRGFAPRAVLLAAVSVVALTAGSLAQERGGGHGLRPIENHHAQQMTQAGEDILGYGESFLAVGTRDNQQAAVAFAREYAGDYPTAAAAQLSDGKWATLIGIVDTQSGAGLMQKLRAAGRIPNGSFLLPAARVRNVAWAHNGEVSNGSLQLPDRIPMSPLLTGLGIAGNWAASPRYCAEPDESGDLLESRMTIEPRAMNWGTFGACTFGSIVRVNGGVYLDANCGSGDKRESFVLGLRRQGNQLTVVTDPGEKHRLTYTLQACGRVNAPPVAVNQPPQNRNPQTARLDPPSRITPPPPRTDGDPGKPRSTGSGFFISSNGYIVTNEHVIKACSRVFVAGHGEARMLKADVHNDLALLKVQPKKPVPYLRIRTAPVDLGQDIVVFGFPLASFLGNGLNVTTGIVSANTGMRSDDRMLQFTAAIQPGNSGGPVVDRSGHLVAVVRSMMSHKYAMEKGSFVPQGLNYGIKTDVLLKFLGDNNINPEKAAPGATRTVAELAGEARDHTILVTCHGNTGGGDND